MNHNVYKPVTVDATQGGYEEHPESYNPRIILTKAKDVVIQNDHAFEFYELLTTGFVITWGKNKPPASMRYIQIYINDLQAVWFRKGA
jgi:hypothetical protein